jgi:predicted RNA-binding Zn-ribbon protein involved in translation (DUF1610 family)
MMSSSVDYNFVCPECAESITVNASMKEALLDHGCVICGTTVTKSAFTRD